MKKTYEIVTPLKRGGKRSESGTVELDAEEGDALAAIGALRVAETQRKPAPPPPAPPPPAPPPPAPPPPAPPPPAPPPPAPPPPAPPPPAADAKPLAEQSLEELKATAKAEKVPRYGLIKDEAKLREAIEAHRAKSAS